MEAKRPKLIVRLRFLPFDRQLSDRVVLPPANNNSHTYWQHSLSHQAKMSSMALTKSLYAVMPAPPRLVGDIANEKLFAFLIALSTPR